MGHVSSEPALLNDEQMRQFIANGYVLLRPSVPDALHQAIDEKFNYVNEHEFNPGNNILPRIPELNEILDSPEVRGALISVLGENYITHPHRFWHTRPPAAESTPEVEETVSRGCHQDAYSPSTQPRSHRTRYARIMYYSQDTPIELGPTHVIAGTQYHDALTEEDRNRTLSVDGGAGLVFLSHFDIGHAAGVNLLDRTRHMIKFIFIRADEPQQPTWNCKDVAWQPPENLTAPYNLDPAWRNMWSWHCGTEAALRANPQAHRPDASLIDTLSGNASVKDKLTAMAQLADAGSAVAAAVPELTAMLNTAHQALRTSAVYTLAAIAEPAVEPLCELLERAGVRVCDGAESPKFDDRWITLHDAAYALGAIGAPALGPLQRLLNSPHEWTRMNAAFALGEMDSAASSAVPTLEAALRDESHYVIRIAASSLGTIQKTVASGKLVQLLTEKHPAWLEEKKKGWTVGDAVSVTVAVALTRLGHQAAASEEDLMALLRAPFDQAGFFAAQALNRIGSVKAKQAVIENLLSQRWDSNLNKHRKY